MKNTTGQNATDASDKELQIRAWQKGRAAADSGKTIGDCPWMGGPAKQWWLDGFYNKNYPVGLISAG